MVQHGSDDGSWYLALLLAAGTLIYCLLSFCFSMEVLGITVICLIDFLGRILVIFLQCSDLLGVAYLNNTW